MITYPQIDPIAFELGPLAIRWYGLSYLAGVFCAYLFLKKEFFKEFSWKPDTVLDFLSWVMFGVLLGGRFGYVLFYDFSFFIQNPLHIFSVWEGGMSYHGGAIGAMFGVILFARKRNVSFWPLLDLLGLGSCFGLFFGRLANFVNGELYGRYTDVSWGMIFPNGGPFARHPSQLYEAFFEGIVLFLILWGLRRKASLQQGQLFGFYLVGYGVFRFFIEFFREPDAQLGTFIGFFSMGQLLCGVMISIGVFVLLKRQQLPVG